MKTYFTVINENCESCGHKHRNYGNAVDCFDRLVNIPADSDPVIISAKNNIPLEVAAHAVAAWQKYSDDTERPQEFIDKWLN